jgi:hypothetical protein
MHYALRGYDTNGDYDARTPCWEPNQQFADLDSATRTAQAWVLTRSSEALVEVIAIRGREGRVRRLVGRSAVEEMA